MGFPSPFFLGGEGKNGEGGGRKGADIVSIRFDSLFREKILKFLAFDAIFN